MSSSCICTLANRMTQPLQRRVRRPALLNGLAARGLHLVGLLPRLAPLLAAAHEGPHRPLQLRGLDEVVAPPVHLHGHGHAHDGHELERVQVLLRVQRPRRQRHAVPQALHRRVPPAVGHEAAHGRVGEHRLLRRPPRPHEAPAPGPLQEPRGEELVQVGVRRVPRSGRGRPAQRPQEPVPAPLQPRRGLARLRRVEPAQAPEAEEHHRRTRLRVEPPDARLVAGRTSPRTEVENRTDRVQRRRRPSRHAPASGDGGEQPRFELGHRVDDDAVGVHETPAVVNEPREVGAVLASQEPRDACRGHGRQARHVDRALERLEVGGDSLGKGRQPQREREQRGRGGEVDVRRHGEPARHVQHGGGEEVDHERRGAELPRRGLHVRPVELQVPRLELLQVAGAVRRGLHGREVVEPDASNAGLRDAPDVRAHLGGRLRRRRPHDEDGHRELPAQAVPAARAVAQQALPGFDERHEVAGARLREEQHVEARHISPSSPSCADKSLCSWRWLTAPARNCALWFSLN
uniref:Uncharacterized protein n=1 Tax=Zea mays TaxID=4577 RepID=A0A804QC48_MAIZE